LLRPGGEHRSSSSTLNRVHAIALLEGEVSRGSFGTIANGLIASVHADKTTVACAEICQNALFQFNSLQPKILKSNRNLFIHNKLNGIIARNTRKSIRFN